MIMCDQLRGDSLGFAGHPCVETPHLDQLAAEGVRFTNAYSAVPSCIAARASLLTGKAPRNHGRTGYEDGVPFGYGETLPRSLADAGYHTQAVGKNHFYPPRALCGYHNSVLLDGFLQAERPHVSNYGLVDDYVRELKEKEGADADMVFHGVGCNSYLSRSWPYDESLHPTSWVTSKGIDFLRRRDPTRPFFLKLSYLAPHPPYVPVKEFLELYADAPVPDPIVGDWVGEVPMMPRTDGCRGKISADRMRRLRQAYYALITQVDYQVGRFLIHLEEMKERENSVIIFCSDHGEMLGDHHLYRKAVPFEGAVKIPFFIHFGSALRGGRAGKVVDEITELRDVMPTLLDLLDLPIPEGVDGLSLLPLMDDVDGRAGFERSLLHGEHCLEGIPGYEDFGSCQYLVSKDEKYIWFPQTNRELLFRLDRDPDELHDLSADCPERIAFFRQRMAEELEGREEGYVRGGRLQSGVRGKNTLQFMRNALE